ncbi:MAG: DUF5808 domain-containing protein, partial [Gorillibacterium sp.]|nr:DUF5808 domain-containing protein [Gorillibacterium sp.]
YLGGLYYNRDDPRFFVEKYIGIGYTINFAQILSTRGIGFLLAIGVFILVYSYIRHN